MSYRSDIRGKRNGLEHHLTTGERVTGGSDNAKTVVKTYKKNGQYRAYQTR